MEKPKVTISAHQVLEDLRSGMEDEGLMVKYNLSYRQLQRLYRKMINGGFISAMELAQRLCVTKSQVTEAFTVMEQSVKELK